MKKVASTNIELIRQNKKIVTANLAVWLLISCIPLFISVCVQNIFDYLEMGHGDMHLVWCAILVGIAIIQGYIIILGGKVDTITRFDIRSRLRGNLLYQSIKDRRHKQETGEMLEILSTDILAFEELITVEIDLVCKLIFAIVSVILIFRIDYYIVLIIVFPMVIVSNIIYKLCEKIKARYNDSREANIQYTQLVENIVVNHEIIQMVAREKNILKKTRSVLDERAKASIKSDVINFIANELSDVANIISVFFILIYVVLMVSKRDFTTGELVLVTSLTSYIGSYNGLFTETLCSIQFVSSTISRLQNLFESKEYSVVKKVDINRGNDDILTLDNKIQISMKLNQNMIHADINKGEVLVITGKNGVGKTYLIDALLGYARFEGEIIVDGKKVDYLHGVGISLQRPSFLNEPLYENLNFDKTKDIEQALEMVNLNIELEELKNNCEEMGVDGRRISEGQRQRLSIARAIMVGSNVLILDDSTTLLDKENEIKIIRALRENGYTVVIASNRQQVLEMADKCIVLGEGEEDGEIVCDSV